VKRSAKPSQAEGLPRHKLRKRNGAQRRKPRQRRKQTRSVCSAVHNVFALLMGLSRLRKQRQRRRRLLLPTLRRRHAALQEPRLRNNAPCQGSCRFTWLSLPLCRPHSLVVAVTDSSVTFVLIALCVHDITHDYVCDGVRCLSSHSMATCPKITE
jgi:hypothetical protein